MKNFFNNARMPLTLLSLLGFVALLGDAIPLIFKQVAYTLSLMLQEALIFALPLIIFSFIAFCLMQLGRGTWLLVLTLLGAVCVSNFASVWLAYGIGVLGLQHMPMAPGNLLHSTPLLPLWTLQLPRWCPNFWALGAGLFCGLLIPYGHWPRLQKLVRSSYSLALFFLQKVFTRCVPVFVLGFLLKLQHEQVLGQLTRSYGPMLGLIVLVQWGYILLLYAWATGFRAAHCIQALKNMSPALLTGLSTMSSAATLPLTLQGTELNTHHPKLAQMVTTSTVNIHLLGDSIAVPLLVLMTAQQFGFPLPSPSQYLVFSLFFVATKFAAAAVPGGGILVLLAFFKSSLGFSSEMVSLITAVYLLLDSVSTSANVGGNGAFAMLFCQGWRKWGPKTHSNPQAP
jgi:Na+/H+-dicarboxylate symporter